MENNNTPLTRRIDDLGRVVIPKEFRRHFGIKEGDPLEVHITEEGILFKPNSLKYCCRCDEVFTTTGTEDKCVACREEI